MLAVISNQHLIKNNIRRKQWNAKPRIPPHPTTKQEMLSLRRMGYPAQKIDESKNIRSRRTPAADVLPG